MGKKFMQQAHQYVPVARERMAMAAELLPGLFRQGGDQVGRRLTMDFVLRQG